MKNNIIELKEIFNRIKNKEWIKSLRKGNTGIGYTFECLINKEEDNLEIPDFKLLEIKTRRKYSDSFISLFNATPDGDYLFEIKRITKTYGYPDQVLKNCKVINEDVFANKLTNLGTKFKTTIKIDYEQQKLRLHILNNVLELIDSEVSWSFELLKEKFYRKLKYLALIEADHKYIKNEEYFKYKDLTIYEAKEFETFLSLIEQGDIKITFKVGVFRSGKRKGENHDHGTSFSIEKNSLNKLFNKI